MKEYKDGEINYIDEIIKFNNNHVVQRLRDIYYNQNIADIFAFSRKEMNHSSFLAWLFTSSANHMFGYVPVIQLLELYVSKEHENNDVSLDKLSTAIITRSIHFFDCQAKTEECVNVKKGRTDIVIHCNVNIPDSDIDELKIVIENKINSYEHNNQTENYFNYYNNLKNKKEGKLEVLYIFLTPPNSSEANNSNFVNITYQDLLNSVLYPLIQKPDINQRTQFILSEYINCLTVPSDIVNEKNGFQIQTSILAIGREEQDLLLKFWEEHQNLIEKLNEAQKGSFKEDELLQKFWEENNKFVKILINACAILKSDNKTIMGICQDLNKRDYSKYRINDDPKPYGKNPAVKQVIMEYINSNSGKTIEELRKKFPDTLHKRYGVIKSTVDDKYRDRYYEVESEKIKDEKKTFFICHEWELNSFNKFIEHASELGIKIEKCR